MNESNSVDSAALAGHIQHTLASSVVTRAALDQHLEECIRYGFNAAMVPPCAVAHTVSQLADTSIRVASWVGFPMGTDLLETKVHATQMLVREGVDEIDLMPNVGLLIDDDEEGYHREINDVVSAANDRPVKVMLELPLLPASAWSRAVALSVDAGVAYVKNASSGAVGVATPEQIRFLAKTAPPSVKVKASGGIKHAQQALDLLHAGADLIGTSAGTAILDEFLTGAVTTADEEITDSY